MSGALKRQVPVSILLIVIIAFSAGVAALSYFWSLVSQNQTVSTITEVVTVPATPSPSLSVSLRLTAIQEQRGTLLTRTRL